MNKIIKSAKEANKLKVVINEKLDEYSKYNFFSDKLEKANKAVGNLKFNFPK